MQLCIYFRWLLTSPLADFAVTPLYAPGVINSIPALSLGMTCVFIDVNIIYMYLSKKKLEADRSADCYN